MPDLHRRISRRTAFDLSPYDRH